MRGASLTSFHKGAKGGASVSSRHLFKVIRAKESKIQKLPSPSLQNPTPALTAKPGKSPLKWGRRAEGPALPLPALAGVCMVVVGGDRSPAAVSQPGTHTSQ